MDRLAVEREHRLADGLRLLRRQRPVDLSLLDDGPLRRVVVRDALAAEGRHARISFHEQQRGNFTNVYLDAVELTRLRGSSAGGPEEAVPPDELYERLQPFKERVANDLRGEPADEDG